VVDERCFAREYVPDADDLAQGGGQVAALGQLATPRRLQTA
jgi:hypothetical protein